MRRPALFLTSLFLALVSLLSPSRAAVLPRDETLFPAGQPAAAMDQLETRLGLTIADTTEAVSLDILRTLETAVNFLSADLVREAAQRLRPRAAEAVGELPCISWARCTISRALITAIFIEPSAAVALIILSIKMLLLRP